MHAATCPLGDGLNDSPLSVGDVVDGDIEQMAWGCEDCEDFVSAWPMHVGQPDMDAECDSCGGVLVRRSGTVSVPHVVTQVRPLLAKDILGPAPESYIYVLADGRAWLCEGDVETPLILPDAEPGGVCLIVERQP
jgi:hypothetical protein